MPECEYAKSCLYYTSKSVTCTANGGGCYCGVWKFLNKKAAAKKAKQDV